MKYVFLILLLLLGVLLIVTPASVGLIKSALVTEIFENRPDFKTVSLAAGIEDEYAFGCFATGFLMIVFSLIGFFKALGAEKQASHRTSTE